ncbi:MAG: type II toxin-antitoxin system RelE/ParE family toxin [Acidobacteriota bacterium]|jgi:toxin ParE1/3/4
MAELRIEPEASAELTEAAVWYEKQRTGLGRQFLRSVDAAVEFMGRFPGAGAPVPELSSELVVRRMPVKRFPFHVVYLERSGQIHILAFAHDRRLPGYWRSRTKKR